MSDATSPLPQEGEPIPQPSGLATTNADTLLPDILARLRAFEEGINPRLQAVEERLERLAKRAIGVAEHVSLGAELDELKSIVLSLGGGLFGSPGHDAGKLFHEWWNTLRGAPAVKGDGK